MAATLSTTAMEKIANELSEEDKDAIIEQLQKDKIQLQIQLNMTSHKSKHTLAEIIKYHTNYLLERASPELLHCIKIIANNAREIVRNQYGNVVKKERVNEAGNFMESIMLMSDPMMDRPLTIYGKYKSSGYPDTELKDRAYIEVKLVAKNGESSSLRSFYLSSFDKITKTQPHVLVAFFHENMTLTDDPPKIIDLYDTVLQVKTEYATNNKGLYNFWKSKITMMQQIFS